MVVPIYTQFPTNTTVLHELGTTKASDLLTRYDLNFFDWLSVESSTADRVGLAPNGDYSEPSHTLGTLGLSVPIHPHV